MSIGIGMVYMPSSSVTAQHFHKRRALAMGIITTGGAIGGFFFSRILSQFLDPKSDIGFDWGIRIVAFISLGVLVIANMLMRTNYPMKKPDEVVPTMGQMVPTLKQPVWISIMLFGIISCLAIYDPLFGLQLFAEAETKADPELAKWLLSILNLVSVLGRIIPNALADRFGVYPVYTVCAICSGTVALTLFVCKSTAAIVVWSILYGFFSGSMISLFFPAVLSLTPDPRSKTAGYVVIRLVDFFQTLAH